MKVKFGISTDITLFNPMNINMVKYLFLSFSFLVVVSCNAQTDLETFKVDEIVSENIIEKSAKETEPIYGLLSYRLEDIQNYRLGSVGLSAYSISNGYNYSNNNLALIVNNYQENKYLGFILNLVKEEDGKGVTDFLIKTYGKPENRQADKNSLASFWDVSSESKWIFLLQTQEPSQDGKKYKNVKVFVVKKGTRVDNSTDSTVFSILESFNLAYPKD
ncbi:hypothetical protein [Chryseobacterium arachidis]|nr:hypothetical protein [Chryseobacterium arachidis]